MLAYFRRSLLCRCRRVLVSRCTCYSIQGRFFPRLILLSEHTVLIRKCFSPPRSLLSPRHSGTIRWALSVEVCSLTCPSLVISESHSLLVLTFGVEIHGLRCGQCVQYRQWQFLAFPSVFLAMIFLNFLLKKVYGCWKFLLPALSASFLVSYGTCNKEFFFSWPYFYGLSPLLFLYVPHKLALVIFMLASSVLSFLP